MQNITLYLHIGAGKTGTSSIQNFLAVNSRELWESCSCLYPNMWAKKFLAGGFINHQKFFTTTDVTTQTEKIKEAVRYCRKNNKEKLVLSAELLFESINGPALAEKLSAIPGLDLKIIVYLRRQDHWLESAWKQWGYKSDKYRNIADYIQKRDCNWLRRLQLWEQGAGRAGIIVGCYEKEQLPYGLIPDFLRHIGIDYTSHPWVEQKDLLMGFDRDVMEILFLNKKYCHGEPDVRLQTFFENYLDESFQKESFKAYSFLSPKERISVLERNEKSNQIIAREYLGREDSRLYYEPWPDPSERWSPYEGLTVEKVVPLFAQILCTMDDRFTEDNNRHVRKKVSDGDNKNSKTVKGRIHSLVQWIKEKNYRGFL
jgi:hypothetical protein